MADDETDETVEPDPRRSRRHLLTAAGGALGVAVAGSLISAGPASATQGQPVIAGQDNTSTSATGFTTTSGNNAGLTAVGSGTGGGVTGTGGASAGYGVIGNGGGTNGSGMRAMGIGIGAGLSATGGNSNGIGVLAAGGGNNGIGVKTTGSGGGAGVEARGGDLDAAGVSGTGGGLAGDGVLGSGAGGGTGVHGIAGPNDGNALFASVNQAGSQGHAILAISNGVTPIVDVRGDAAQLRLRPITPTRVQPQADAVAHELGEILSDGTGNLWYCAIGGTPGTWRQIAGANTAGAFHVLHAPARVYDSRPGTAPSVPPKTPLVANTARTLDLTVNSSGVPAGATAATVNVLLVNAVAGNGNFTIWANGVARPQGNNMVWGGSSGRFSSTTITALDTTGKCQVQSNLGTDLVLDVVGYYL